LTGQVHVVAMPLQAASKGCQPLWPGHDLRLRLWSECCMRSNRYIGHCRGGSAPCVK
jgi:hypothetical protein